MIKQIIQIEGRKGILATTNIANLVKDSTKQATKILLGELLLQAETIFEFTACLKQTERNTVNQSSGVPSIVSTDPSTVMNAQYQAMQAKINPLKAAATTASVATTSVVKPPGTRKKDK